jgi:hypothetical protein
MRRHTKPLGTRLVSQSVDCESCQSSLTVRWSFVEVKRSFFRRLGGRQRRQTPAAALVASCACSITTSASRRTASPVVSLAPSAAVSRTPRVSSSRHFSQGASSFHSSYELAARAGTCHSTPPPLVPPPPRHLRRQQHHQHDKDQEDSCSPPSRAAPA